MVVVVVAVVVVLVVVLGLSSSHLTSIIVLQDPESRILE